MAKKNDQIWEVRFDDTGNGYLSGRIIVMVTASSAADALPKALAAAQRRVTTEQRCDSDGKLVKLAHADIFSAKRKGWLE